MVAARGNRRTIMESRYNLNSSAVKRILREAREFDQDPPDGFIAAPLDVRTPACPPARDRE